MGSTWGGGGVNLCRPTQGFAPAFGIPFVVPLVPADALELRGVGLRETDARRFDVVCPRSVLLRCVITKRCPLAFCPPFVPSFLPADALELRRFLQFQFSRRCRRRSALEARAGGSSGRDDVEGVTEARSLDVVRPRRVPLRRVIAQM